MKRALSLFLSLVIVMGVIISVPVTASASNAMVEGAINWAVNIAKDNSYGYSQVNRYGNPDYDCSSLVSTAFHNAGFNVACELNTRTMKDAFVNAGFTWIPASQISGFPSSCANLQRGDILLASGHTELYIGNGKNVGAHMDYNGIPGGIGGGSTWSSGYNAYRYGADEIDVCNYWNDNWLGVLRYNGASGNYTEPPSAPQNVRTSTGANLFTVSDYITFYWDASFAATNYWIYMWKDGEQIYATDMGNNTSFTSAPSSAGKYTLIVRAGNSYGYSDGPASVDFIIYDSAPSAPDKVWGEKTSFSSEEYFTINWNSVDIATEYWVYMWKDGEQIYQTNMGNSTSLTSAPTSPGEYTLIVRAGNAYGYSNDPCSFDFTVYNPNEKYTITYNANGGIGAPSPQTKTYGQTLTLSSTKPTRSGYTFLGWSASSTATKATYSAGGSFTTNANTTLYAVWQKNHSHSYTGTVTKEPTCTRTGVRTYKCSCGASYTQTISATGHTESEWFTDYSATVEYSGSKYKECTECGEVLETATIPQLKCATPKLTKAANTVSGVKVTWDAVEGADSYRVYRRAGGVYTWSYIGTTTDTSFTDSKATNNKYWIYTVIAVNEAGYSGFDKVGKTVKCVTAPKITSVSNTASGLYMKWNAVPGAKEYRVYRKGLNYKTWMYLGTTKNTWFTDSPIKNANGYYYKYTVIAVNDYYSGFYEDCAFTKRLSNPVLKSAVSSKTGITVKWNSVYGSTGYYVYRKTANSGWTLVGSTKGVNNATYIDKTAKKGVTYTYTVRAYYGKTLSSYNSGISCKDKY